MSRHPLTMVTVLCAASLAASRWNVSLPLDGLYRLAWRFYHWLRQVSRLVTDTLEGDGGIEIRAERGVGTRVSFQVPFAPSREFVTETPHPG